MRLLPDIETNGLLDRPDLKVLCVVARDIDTGEEYRFRGFGHPDEARDRARCRDLIDRAALLVGHNLAGFDLPVLERWFGVDWQYRGDIYDTRCVSRSRYFSTIEQLTWALRRSAGPSEEAQEARYPKRLLAPDKLHKLEAWGYRLGIHKGSYLADAGVQEQWSQELEDYCARDVQVNLRLFVRLQQSDQTSRGEIPAPPFEAMLVESKFAYLLGLQERNGVRFDVAAAGRLYAQLCGRRAEITKQLQDVVPPWYRPETGKGDPTPPELRPLTKPGDASVKVPKVTYKVQHPHVLAGREKGCAYTPVERVEFNPGSRQEIADRLRALYGWKPQEYTKTGDPKIDEQVLAELDYPPIPLLVEYLTIDKLAGTIADGDKAWMKLVNKSGLIHGVCSACGARTGRCSHIRPNLAQVPKVGKPFGAECRAMFGPTRAGWLQVGVDAAGCQLRMLAHRLAYFDGGEFGRVLLQGDPHETWRLITGLFIRNNQKTLTYAFLFGAGDYKLGKIIVDDWREALAKGLTTEKPPTGEAALRRLGAAAKRRLLAQVPGLQQLLDACAEAYRRRWVRTLDKRVVHANTEHGVLNDVLQGDEAVLMRHAKVMLHEELTERGLKHGQHFAYMLDVHDEWQFECMPALAEPLGKRAADCIRRAGEKLGCRVPMAGEYKVGHNWMETH
jgi:hypothetical protein